jgi:hypothetical protein
MINKKILAAAIATAFTFNANATIDLSASPVADTPVSFASEAVIASQIQTDGLITVVAAGTQLSVSTPAGFAIPATTERFVRFDLTDAEFETPLVDGSLITAGPIAGVTITKLTGGGAGDNSVVFQVTTGANPILTTTVLTLAIVDLNISASAAVTVNYTIHADLSTAIADSGALKEQTATTVQFKSAATGDIANSGSAQALVVDDFTTFTGDADFAAIGEVTGDAYVTAGLFNPADGSAVTAATLLDASQALVFSGNFTFGTWNTATAADCTTGAAALTVSTDGSTATSAATLNVSAGTDYFLCVDNTDEDTVTRGTYSVTLADDELTATVGTITYDTTSVAIPYLTTFSSYNQRVYLINSGNAAAKYSTSFLAEAGVTAVAGTAATGSIPAGGMIAIKATDMVTLTGKTRTSATIEIEADDLVIKATSQSVNLSDGSTDTTPLVVTQ